MDSVRLDWLNLGFTLTAWIFGAGMAWGFLKWQSKQLVADVVKVTARVSILERTDAFIFGNHGSENLGASPFVLKGECERMHSESTALARALSEDMATRDKSILHLTSQVGRLQNVARWQLTQQGLDLGAIEQIMNGGK